MVIFDLTKQVAQYFSSAKFIQLLEADNMLQVSNSAHTKQVFALKALQKDVQEMCSKLFEKVYSVFISHLKTQIYPAISRSFTTIPQPLSEDDLDFGGTADSAENQEEETKEEENSKSFGERLEEWKTAEIDELYSFSIPSVLRTFNQDFQAILAKMTLENGVLPEETQSQH